MVTESSTQARGRVGLTAPVAAGALTLIAFGGFAAVSIAGTAPATPLFFAIICAATALFVAICGAALGIRGHTRTARTALWLAVSLTAYLVWAAGAGAAAPSGSVLAEILVALEGGWYMVPVSLAGLVTLVAVEEIGHRPGALRAWRLGILGLILLALGTGVVAVSPETSCASTACPTAYRELGAPFGGLIPEGSSDVFATVFGATTALWMLSMVIVPALAWVAAGRARELQRARLTVVAVASCAPLLTIATNTLLLAAADAGLVDAALASGILSVAFCVPPVIVAGGVLIAHTTRDDGVTGTAGRSVRWVLTGLWALVSAQLACLLASLLAVGARDQAILVASSGALVLGVVFVAAFIPIARRLQTFAVSEKTGSPQRAPDSPAPATPLVGTLSPREREVLALLADGRSNAAIAAELYLSERTIDSHVSSVFDKLGLGRSAEVNRRVQAAAAWLRAANRDEADTIEVAIPPSHGIRHPG